MKKFKSRSAKQTEQSRQLAELLAEKNLLKSVFIDYIKLPISLVIVLSVLLASILSGRILISIENALLCLLTLALFSGLASLSAWAKFQEVPVDLRYKSSRYIANKLWPISLLMVYVYLLLPLGIYVILTGIVLLYLSVFYSIKLPGTQISFQDYPMTKAGVLGGVCSGICLIALLAPGGMVTLSGGVFLSLVFLIAFTVSIKTKLLLD